MSSVFQPGEETAAGAAAMVADGLWDEAPRPEVMFAQHLSNDLAGTVNLSTGPALAMADSLEVVVHGSGGHGSRPEATIDPVVLAAHMVVRLQTLVSRTLDPFQVAVLTVGEFHAGTKPNIIPDSARFAATIRCFDEGVLAHLERDPNLTPTALANLLEPSATSSVAEDESTRRRRAFEALSNPDCDDCRGSTWLDAPILDDGSWGTPEPCPTCHPDFARTETA